MALSLKNEALLAVVRLVVDWLRWTQFVPMLAAWGFLIACLLVAAFTSFQSQTIAVLELVLAIGAAFVALLPESIVPRTADGTIRLSGGDLLNVLTIAWLFAALICVALGRVIGPRIRPRFLQTLGGRLKTAGLAAVLACGAFFVLYAAAPERFNGPLTAALPLFIGGPLLALIVSAWSLTISAGLGSLERSLERSYSGIREE